MQSLVEKILQDAQQEAKEIFARYETDAAKIKEEYAKQIANKKKLLEAQLSILKKTETTKLLSQKRLELNKQTTGQKQKYINEITKEALAGLAEHKKYLDFLKDLIKKSGVQEGELLISSSDYKRFGAALEKYVKTIGANLLIKPDSDTRGGIVLKKGKINYLGSFEIISELLNDELLSVVSKILW